MRWFLGCIIALVIAVAVYLGSAALSLSTLASAARAGDGAKVLEQTDIKALNRSLTNQIVGAYLERIGATRRISPMEKTLINTYGTSIADAMVGKMLTADKLTEMLKTGKLEGTTGLPSFAGLPAFGELPENWLSLLGRVHLIQPVLLGIRVSDTSDPESYTAINLHFEGSDWKLAGIELPKAIVRSLAATLPVK
jgi:hypothetical protein